MSFPIKTETLNIFHFSTYTKTKPEQNFCKFVKVTSGNTHHAAIDQQGYLYTWGEKYHYLFLTEN